MIKSIQNLLRKITGVQTPLFGLSIDPSASRKSSIPQLLDPIYITYPDNKKIISFLQENNSKIVFLNTYIDASVIMDRWEFVERESIDLDMIVSCTFSGSPLPLPNEDGPIFTITFYFLENHLLQYSAGGTGIISVSIKGLFEISKTLHGGPTTAFHLKEIDVPLEIKVDLFNC